MNVFQKWLNTDSGKKCNDFSTLKNQKYLENRLYHAYTSGMIEEYNRSKTIDATLEWYEQKKREADKLIRELKAKVERLEAEHQQFQQQ